MSAAEDVTSLQEGDNLPGETESTSHCQDVVSFQEMTKEPLGDYGAQQNEGCKVEEVMAALTVEETEEECQNSDRSQSISEVVSSDESVKSSNMVQEEVVKKLLEEQEQDALLFLCPAQPESLDVLMIQSESNGTVDVVKVERTPSEGEGKASPTTWTSANLREFKHRMASEKHGLLTVRRGEVMTVRVPTHPEGKRLCWEFATDDYDIGFGMYFDWTPVTSTAVTLQGMAGKGMSRGALYTGYGVDMEKSCKFAAGTVTERYKQVAMSTLEKGSTCLNWTIPIPSCVTRLYIFMYTTAAEECSERN
ncbi:hypothetical protein GDO86_015885 [Hymenochirus boettgeri]|uniref:GOLD domain-containing protein n=1 Tax=Hymenochirus boettgeri TaxID=247094 RepID=A0A8T2K370_9PIPI|nr:hypothetical protein GDO86_015885 [Hymenochirus boettgeri]